MHLLMKSSFKSTSSSKEKIFLLWTFCKKMRVCLSVNSTGVTITTFICIGNYTQFYDILTVSNWLNIISLRHWNTLKEEGQKIPNTKLKNHISRNQDKINRIIVKDSYEIKPLFCRNECLFSNYRIEMENYFPYAIFAIYE